MDLLKMAAELLLENLGGKGAGIDQNSVQQALLGLLGSDAAGGLDLSQVLGKLQGGDLMSMAASWLGDGDNTPMDPAQVGSLFGQAKLGAFAGALGIDEDTAAGGLAGMLPELIDKNSKGGSLLDAVGGGAGLLGAASKLFG
ncbi:MAG: YidB family protein [Gammaproteobacteria bacterium]